MRRQLWPIVLFAIVPALAFAAPKKGKRPRGKGKKPAVTKPVEPAAKDPTPTPDPSTKPAPKEGTPADAAIKPAAPPTPTTPSPPATPTPTNAGSGSPTAGGAADPAVAGGQEPPEPKRDGPDVDTLRQEYLALRDELFRSRARANTVASQLFTTRVQIKLTYTTARFYQPGKATIRLDGATVYENASGAIGTDDAIRFDGYVAPGRHLITFRVEATGKDDDSFTSVTETQIVAKAVAGKDLVVAAKARDAGNIAYEWKRKERGSYGLGIDVTVKTTPRAQEGKR